MIAPLLALLVRFAPLTCWAPSTPWPIEIVTWTALDGAHCIGPDPYARRSSP